MWLSSSNYHTVPRPWVIQPCISENVGMYRKLYKQVFNTNPTLFVMLSITCDARYWNRHLSVPNYCSILLCSHIHVRVYLYTSCCLYNYGEKDRTRETNKSCLKWRHLRTVRSQALIFCCIFNLIFGGFVVAIFLILMKKWFALWQLLLIIL